MHGLIGAFDEDTDLAILPNNEHFETLSISNAMPRTFPRNVQCVRIACFSNEIIRSAFLWLADPFGSATTVREVELQFQWFGLRNHIPDFPVLSHARGLRELRIGQDGSAQGIALSGVLSGAGAAPILRVLDIRAAFDDSQSPLMHLPRILFPQLEEFHTTCLQGMPTRGDYWVRSERMLAITLVDEIRLLRRRLEDTRLVAVITDMLQVLTTEVEGVDVDIRVRLANDTT